MGSRWKLFGFQLHKVLCVVLMFHLLTEECLALNLEGLALIGFRSKVEFDPYGVFQNWDPKDNDPCRWSGVHCVDGKVETLNLNGMFLRGVLAPELGRLSHLRALVLYKNNFFGSIPKEISNLSMLELLDLRANNLSGIVPQEIGEISSLKHLLLYDNRFEGGIPSQLGKLNFLSKLQFDRNLSFDVQTEFNCLNRKVQHCFWQSSLQQLKKGNPFTVPPKRKLLDIFNVLPRFKFWTSHSYGHEVKQGDILESFAEPFSVQKEEHFVNFIRRRLLEETRNLPATPVNSYPVVGIVYVPSTGSGSFPAVPNGNKKPPPAPVEPPNSLYHGSSPTLPSQQHPGTSSQSIADEGTQSSSGKGLGKWTYLLVVLAVVALIIIAIVFLMGRSRGAATIDPWKTGLSGPLQKAFTAGVPKLNRAELEAACEDFSNIIQTYPQFVMFKGTLSSGVEIAVASSVISSFKDWSKRSEAHFRKKVDMLSRVNHKNFVNLLGYCEEDEPFMRAMTFEYAPNGTLSEHLHVKELEHLDWSTRMRIIMGITYCLQYMHHELNPPVSHPNLQTSSIFLTDDYAAKIGEIDFWKEFIVKGKISGDDDADNSELPPADPGSNVYDFGVLLLEIISGKPPYSEGSIVNWATEHLTDKSNNSYLVDPTLKFVKNEELDVICQVIQECVHLDPKKRPTMKEVTAKLRSVIAISPESATPRLSPLWWAELEILSVEAT